MQSLGAKRLRQRYANMRPETRLLTHMINENVVSKSAITNDELDMK
jgi:hypothetical protein